MAGFKRVFCSLLAAALVFCALSIAPESAQAGDVAFEETGENEFMVTPRIRAIAVPGFILGIWFDEHANHWEDGANMSYGLDFVWRKVGDFEISTGIDYADLSMGDAFWQEEGEPATDAEFTEVDLQFLSLTAAGYWYWDVQPWLSPYVGGGLGVGHVMGDVVTYEPRDGSECRGDLSSSFAPPSCFESGGEPNEEEFQDPEIEDSVPGILPVVNVSGGARFNIGEYAVAKLELGFQNYFFGGLSLGGQW